MSFVQRFFNRIPGWLSSQVSIFIYLFLFFYLVIFALVCLVFPVLHALEPTRDAQLILGNYTNVISALGASIAAGSSASLHHRMKEQHAHNEKLKQAIDQLHERVSSLADDCKTMADEVKKHHPHD